MSIFSPLEIERQAPYSTTFLFFWRPFHSQEEKGLKGAFKKETPFLRYLLLRESTQRWG
jgi:hypothetical protein